MLKMWRITVFVIGAVLGRLNSMLPPPQNRENCEKPLLKGGVLTMENAVEYLEEGNDMYATNCEGMSLMHMSIHDGRNDIPYMLLHKGFDLNRIFPDGSTVLKFTITESIEIAQKLIKLGANINQKLGLKGRTYLHLAAIEGDFIMMERLIQLGADVDALDRDNNTPLAIAVQRNNPAMMNLLVTAGANINMLKKGHDSPLHVAVKYNCTACLRRFLDEGFPLDARGFDENTPLVLAIGRNDTTSAEILTEFGADLKARWHNNKINLLHWAAMHGSIGSIHWLVERGLNVNDTDIHKYIPLHYAAGYGHLNAVQTLVELGSFINCKNERGDTPIDFAKFSVQPDIVEYLKSKGAVEKPNDSYPTHPTVVLLPRI